MVDKIDLCDDLKLKIQLIYVIAIVLWIILIFILDIHKSDWVGWIFLSIPIIVYSISFSYASGKEHDIADDMFGGDFLSFAFLTIVIIINWSKITRTSHFFKIILVSAALLMMSLIDVWVDKEKIIIIKIIKSILQTAALSLLIYALYLYYLEVTNYVGEGKSYSESVNYGFGESGDTDIIAFAE